MTNQEIKELGNEISLYFCHGFSAALDREMTNRHMSAPQLSKRIGYSANAIRAWRRDSRWPSVKGMSYAAAYFGYNSLFAFIGGAEIQRKIDDWVESVKINVMNDLEVRQNSLNISIRDAIFPKKG